MSGASSLSLYASLAGLHVITGILGLGPLTALSIITTWFAPTASRPPDYFAPLLRLIGWSLFGMLASGAGLVAFTHGALGETWWLRVSFALFLVLGFLHGQARRQLRHWSQAMVTAPPTRLLRPILWGMCALVTVITYLMEAKPW